VIDCAGTGFLRQMVRSLAKAVLDVGFGVSPPGLIGWWLVMGHHSRSRMIELAFFLLVHGWDRR
jgi:tRNA U38,U39,U40 pseudouridine synthase TruA